MLKKIFKILSHSSRPALQSAFDKFYSELLQSPEYSLFLEKLKGDRTLSYNLLSQKELLIFKEWLGQRHGTLLDYGCGLGLSAALCPRDLTVYGQDFSSVAIQYNQKNFPNHFWSLKPYTKKKNHLNSFDHLVCMDSLYMLNQDKKTALTNLFRPIKRSAIIFQNLNEDLPQIKGWHEEIIDVTECFHQYLDLAEQMLSLAPINQERQKFSVLWDTISKEIFKHRQQNMKRKVVRYEKYSP